MDNYPRLFTQPILIAIPTPVLTLSIFFPGAPRLPARSARPFCSRTRVDPNVSSGKQIGTCPLASGAHRNRRSSPSP
jgi:hypothetical protein